MNYSNKFRVKPGSKVDLNKIDAGFKDKHESHEQALPEIEAYDQKLHDLQYLMYAEGKRSLLRSNWSALRHASWIPPGIGRSAMGITLNARTVGRLHRSL